LRDPRSQKRDLGHPSVLPFDIAEGTGCVISLPTRLSEPVARDDKGEGNGSIKGAPTYGTAEAVPVVVTALSGMASVPVRLAFRS
jgi:hypothetical protein